MTKALQPGGKVGRPTAAELEERRARYAADGLDEYGLPLEPISGRNRAMRPQHQDEVRAKIQAANLVTLLQKNVAGELKHPITKEPYELSPGRIKSAEILLSKSLSTLSATEVVSVNANDRMTESEILAKIADLLRTDPRLIQLAAAAGAGRVIEMNPDPLPPSDDCIVCGNDGLPGGCPACGHDGRPGGPDGADGT